MARTAPTWRKLFDSWEKAVAPGLEDLTASSEFRDVMALVTRWNAAMAKQTEQASRRWLHLWNLPAASDVRRLRRQISELDDEVAALRKALRSAVDADTADRLLRLTALDVDSPSDGFVRSSN